MHRRYFLGSLPLALAARDLARTAKDGPTFTPNRNLLEQNRIIDSGDARGVGVKVEGRTRSLEIARNEIRETRQPAERTGILLEAETADIRLSGNTIEGFAQPVVDLSKK